MERVPHEAQSAVVRHLETLATNEELQAALRNDETISDAVRNQALEIATQLRQPDSPPVASPNGITADITVLRPLGSHELLYVRSNQTIAALRFDDAKRPTFTTTWLAPPLLIAKPNSSSVFVVCKNRLFELAADAADHPQERRRFTPHTAYDLAFHPTDDRIAWCRLDDPNGDPDLIVSRFDGTDETNLGMGYDPVWTADGRKLIYTSSNTEEGWFIAIREGTETRRIKVPEHPSVCFYPCPSPDGKQIAFSMKGEDGTMQIGLTSMDGTNTRQLTRTGDLNMKSAFSPDGRFLAFVRVSDPNASLVVVNVQTGEETIVANDAASARPVWRSTAAPKN